MPRRTTALVNETDTQASSPEPSAPAPAPLRKLQIAISDGKIATDRMRPETLSELQALVKATPGMLPPAPKAAGDGSAITDEFIDSAYDALFGLAQIVAEARGADPEILDAIKLDDLEHKTLRAPTRRVLAKHLDVAALKYGDEIILLVAIVSIMRSKTSKVKKARKTIAARRPQAVVTSIEAGKAQTDTASQEGNP